MRWEIFNTETQKLKGSEGQPKWIEALLIQFYAYMLKLYPAGFRAVFADEMMDVFVLTVRDAMAVGILGLMPVMWRELRDFPLYLWKARQQVQNRLPAAARRVQQARYFVRIVGGLLSLFLLSTLRGIMSPSYHPYPQAAAFLPLLFIASVSILVAIRWERVGGLLTMGSGVALGFFMSLYLYQLPAIQMCLIIMILVGLLWMLPFIIFGALFYQLSRQPKQQLTPA